MRNQEASKQRVKREEMRTRQVDRKKVEVAGQCCSVQGRLFDISIEDLTKGGCGFSDPADVLKVGSPVNLMISGTGPHRAHVRWKAEGKVGVSFQRPLSDEMVEDLIEGRKPAPTPDPAPAASNQPSPGASTLPLRRVC